MTPRGHHPLRRWLGRTLRALQTGLAVLLLAVGARTLYGSGSFLGGYPYGHHNPLADAPAHYTQVGLLLLGGGVLLGGLGLLVAVLGRRRPRCWGWLVAVAVLAAVLVAAWTLPARPDSPEPAPAHAALGSALYALLPGALAGVLLARAWHA